MPVYDIDATLDVEALQLNGAARVRVPNQSSDPWTKLVFRLYPMLEHYGGEMVVQSTLVNGRPAAFVYTNDNTALEVNYRPAAGAWQNRGPRSGMAFEHPQLDGFE